MTESSYGPQNYEAQKKIDTFMRMKAEGDYKIRITGEPIVGWVWWTEEDGKKKPVRTPWDQRPMEPDAKEFWAWPVYNYDLKIIQVLNVTQVSIYGEEEGIKNLAENPDWGNPTKYDITIKRTGLEFNDTNYGITPSPPQKNGAFPDEVIQALNDVKINMDLMFKGEYPLERLDDPKAVENRGGLAGPLQAPPASPTTPAAPTPPQSENPAPPNQIPDPEGKDDLPF